MHLDPLQEHWWGVNVPLSICRSSRTFISFSINLNMFADVFNCQAGYSTLLHEGRVGCMFVGH